MTKNAAITVEGVDSRTSNESGHSCIISISYCSSTAKATAAVVVKVVSITVTYFASSVNATLGVVFPRLHIHSKLQSSRTPQQLELTSAVARCRNVATQVFHF